MIFISWLCYVLFLSLDGIGSVYSQQHSKISLLIGQTAAISAYWMGKMFVLCRLATIANVQFELISDHFKIAFDYIEAIVI